MNQTINESCHVEKQPLVYHLVELRRRLLYCGAFLLIVFLMVFPFANQLYTLLSEPLRYYLPESSSMIATEVASPFLTPFKLSLLAALFSAMPFIFYQFWAFIKPGLKQKEMSLMLPLLAGSSLLFYSGAAFAYFVVFPLVFGFFSQAAPDGVTVMTDISSYLDFAIKLFLAFGFAFEIPIITLILIMLGVTSRESLSSMRRYVFVGCFVIGMLLTPPDMISQLLLAIPMWLLFELGLLMSRLIDTEPDISPDDAV